MRLFTLLPVIFLFLVAMPAYGMADTGEPVSPNRPWRASFDTNAGRVADASAVQFALGATPVITRCVPRAAWLGTRGLGAAANTVTTTAPGKWCDDQCFRCAVGFIIGRPDPLACYNCFQVCPFRDPLEPPGPIEVSGKRDDA